MFETVCELIEEAGFAGLNARCSTAIAGQELVRKSTAQEPVKTISKMGISDRAVLLRGQIFEAVGLNRSVIDRTSPAPPHDRWRRLDVLPRRFSRRPRSRLPSPRCGPRALPAGGRYAWRRDGERHMWNPDHDRLCSSMPCARLSPLPTRSSRRLRNEDATRAPRCRSARTPAIGDPIPLEQVEGWQAIARLLTGR